MGTQQGTGFPGQIQVRDPDTLQPQDVFGDANVVRVGLRYYDGSGVPQAQPQIATAEQVTTLIGLSKYTFANLDDASDPLYVGYKAPDGSWKIMQFTSATGVALYAYGPGEYATAWTNRATQSYG